MVGVTDGDTVTVETHDGQRTRIRLWGIDAPERDQPGGEPARTHCAAIALWQTVDVQEVARDKYARLLAVLVRPGQNGRPDWSINGNMVRMAMLGPTALADGETQSPVQKKKAEVSGHKIVLYRRGNGGS